MPESLNPDKCQERVWHGGHREQCTNRPQPGKSFCKIHDPEIKKAKAKARQAEWYAERELDKARLAVTAGLTIEELVQVTPDMLRGLLKGKAVNG